MADSKPTQGAAAGAGTTGGAGVSAHPLVAALNPDAGPNQGVVKLVGYFGGRKKENFERLYLDLSFKVFVDIPAADAIIEVKKVDPDDANSPTQVTVKASVQLEVGTIETVAAGLFQGGISSSFLPAALGAASGSSQQPSVAGCTGFFLCSSGICTFGRALAGAAAANSGAAAANSGAGVAGLGSGQWFCSLGNCDAAAAGAGVAGGPGVAGCTGFFLCSSGICTFGRALAGAAAANGGAGTEAGMNTVVFHMCSAGMCGAAAANSGAGVAGLGSGQWFCSLGNCDAAAAGAGVAGGPGVAGCTGFFLCSSGICTFGRALAGVAAANGGASGAGASGAGAVAAMNTLVVGTIPYCTLGPGCH